jgi:hypothetical protein
MSEILFKGKEIEIGTYYGKRGSYSIKKEPKKTSIDIDGVKVLFYTHNGRSTIVQVEGDVKTRRFPGGGMVSFRECERRSKWEEPIYQMCSNGDFWAVLDEIIRIDDFDVIEGDRQEIEGFLKGIKDKDQLDREAEDLKRLTQDVNVMPPDLSRYGLDAIVISTSYGCGNRCNECKFGPYIYQEVDEEIVDKQIEFYRHNFPSELLEQGVIVLGNQRAGRLGKKLAYYRDKINAAFHRNAPVLAFGNVEDAIDIDGVIMNIGIESGSDEVRRKFGKNYSNDFIISSCLKMKTFSANFLTGDKKHVEATRELLIDMVRAGVNPEKTFIYVSSLSQEPGWYFGQSAIELRDAIRSAGFDVSPYGFFAYSK